MAGRIMALTALLPLAFAFSDTQPIITWSSHRARLLDLLPSELTSSTHSASFLNRILTHDDICDYDAVVLVEQSGLHASDLRTLDPSSSLAKVLKSVPSSRQFPYVSQGETVSSAKAAQSLADRCGSRLVTLRSGEGEVAIEAGHKHVVCIKMPHLEGFAKHRKEAMAMHESHLSSDLETIASLSPKHLVIFTGLPSHLSARQVPTSSEFDSPSSTSVPAIASAPNSTVLEDGGILKRYQILTPALITTLLVTFFILVPIIMFGVSALASIQSPLSSEVPKGFDAQEKKVQ